MYQLAKFDDKAKQMEYLPIYTFKEFNMQSSQF